MPTFFRTVATVVLLLLSACGSSSAPTSRLVEFFGSDDVADASVAYFGIIYAGITGCMTDLGYPPQEYAGQVDTDADPIFGIVYLDQNHIESGIGYGLAEFLVRSTDAIDAAGSHSFQPESLDQAFQYDADYRSCRDAQSGYAEFSQLLLELEDAALEIPEQTFADARVQATNTQWAACMRISGYSFDTPLDAYREIEHHLDFVDHDHSHEDLESGQSTSDDQHQHAYINRLLEIKQSEIQLATADLDCREEVDANYAEIATLVDSEQALHYKEQMERLLQIIGVG